MVVAAPFWGRMELFLVGIPLCRAAKTGGETQRLPCPDLTPGQLWDKCFTLDEVIINGCFPSFLQLVFIKCLLSGPRLNVGLTLVSEISFLSFVREPPNNHNVNK